MLYFSQQFDINNQSFLLFKFFNVVSSSFLFEIIEKYQNKKMLGKLALILVNPMSILAILFNCETLYIIFLIFIKLLFVHILFLFYKMGCAFPESKCQQNLNKMKSIRSTKKSQKLDCRRKSTQFVDTIIENVQIEDQLLTEQEKNFTRNILKKHYLFGQLDEEERQKIIQQIIKAQGFEGQYVFKEGQKGSCFFIIGSGSVQVQVEGMYTRTLKQCDSFGQLALLYASARTASIKCLQPSKFYIVKSGLFRHILKQINVKNYEIVKNCLNRVQAFTFLTNKQKANLSNILVKNHFQKGQIIFEIDSLAHAFYIILEGKIEITISKTEKVILGKYDSFGENAFWDRGRRAGTVQALENTICLVIGKNQIKRALGDNFNSIIYFNIQKWALKKSPLFSYLSNNQIDKLTAQFKVKFAKVNEVLMIENQPPFGLLISIQGKINNEPTGKIFCEQYFGQTEKKLQKSLIKTDPGIYSYLEFNKLDRILSNFKTNKRGSRYSTVSNKQNLGKDLIQINVANFEFIKKLGQGQYGKVYLVRDPTLRGATFAVKCLDKASIIKDSMQNCVIFEKRILQSISFPYIVGYVNSFADEKNIFIVTEFINGVQMFDAIRQIGILNKAIARYYFGCLLLCIEYLHSHNIIYRDLKPQNSVVDHTGKVFLIDMGTAKILKAQSFYRTFTIIGTPHYLAPQVMQGKGYTFQADYWCLGVILYEFICGKLPYAQNLQDAYAIFAQVMKNQVVFPKNFLDQQAKSLIRKLMSKNPSERSSNGGFQAIKSSPYFDGFFWDDLSNEKLKPPYILKQFKKGTKQNFLQHDAKPFLKQIYPGNKNKHANTQYIHQWNEKFY